jgi:recombining binding protein suppressor of hairless
MRDQRLTMSVVTEDGTHLAEQGNPMDEQLQFKYLHVGGAANKAKSFHLSLDIATPTAAQSHSWASFESAPVTIISKPSKKTAKTRNVSTCIMDSGSVSLFNRINSQTVRTKYMTVDRAELAASNASWSAFKIQLLDDELGLPIELGSPSRSADLAPAPRPIHYGARIVLTDEATGISSEPLIVRKVDKGKLAKSDGGLVSQMQKIALQRASINSDVPSSPAGLYLSAGRLPLPVHSADRSAISTTHIQATSDGKTLATAHPLTYQAPRAGASGSNADEVDDFLCWTIVGIGTFLLNPSPVWMATDTFSFS